MVVIPVFINHKCLFRTDLEYIMEVVIGVGGAAQFYLLSFVLGCLLGFVLGIASVVLLFLWLVRADDELTRKMRA